MTHAVPIAQTEPTNSTTAARRVDIDWSRLTTPERAPLKVIPHSHLSLHADGNPYHRYLRHPEEVMITCTAGTAAINQSVFHANYPNVSQEDRRMLAIASRGDAVRALWNFPVVREARDRMLTDDTPTSCPCGCRAGLSRWEALVIAVVLGLAVALLLPYLQQQRLQARQHVCELRQLRTAAALLSYEHRFARFPGYRNLQAIRSDGQRQPASWVFPILPFIYPQPPVVSQEAVAARLAYLVDPSGPYAAVYDSYGPEGPAEQRGHLPSALIRELICPTDRPPHQVVAATRMSFVVNCGMPDGRATTELPADWPANGVFSDQFAVNVARAEPVSLDVLKQYDGEDFTLLLSENVDSGHWTDTAESLVGFVWTTGTAGGRPDPGPHLLPLNAQIGRGDGSIRFARPSSYHPGGVNVVFGSWRSAFLSDDVDYLVYVRLMTSDDHNLTRPGTRQPVDPPYRLPSDVQQPDVRASAQ